MKKLTEDQKFALAFVPAMIVTTPIYLAQRAKTRVKQTAQNHPVAASLVVGSAAGLGLAVALIDGDKAHPNSVYAKTFK